MYEINRQLQDQRNCQRLRRWRQKWIFRTGSPADYMAHGQQIAYGMDFPLPGAWPTPGDIRRRARRLLVEYRAKVEKAVGAVAA